MSIETIHSAHRAAALLAHPLRARILARAREPISAADLARVLEQPRQRVNYHVRQLAHDHFLKPAEQQRKRNMVEQRYIASAHAYVLAPGILGEIALAAADVRDSTSAEQLISLCARAQAEVATVMESAAAAGLRVRVLSMQADVRFESAEQRAGFTNALLDAVSDVVARHSSAFAAGDAEAGPGRPFRLILGCHPVPGAPAGGAARPFARAAGTAQ